MAQKRRNTAGKPAPDSKTTKDEVVRMRVSGAQKAAMVAAAEREGLELSQWLRRLALKEAGALPR